MTRCFLSLLLISSAAHAQQPIPCRPVSGGFVCPGDLHCDTQLLQCVPARAPEPMPCQQSQGAFICPGDLVCNGKHQCVAPPHHPHAEAMRNSGTVLTLVGSGVLVIAINFLAGSNGCVPFDLFGPPPDDNCKIGLGLLAGGVALLGAGIPLWAVGQHWLNRYPQRAQLFIMPVDGGAVAGLSLINF